MMAKEVININGEDRVVREDTAKAFRGVNWAVISLAAFVLIAGTLFVLFFFGATTDGQIDSPANIHSTNSR